MKREGERERELYLDAAVLSIYFAFYESRALQI